jgi:hypothetical protein
VDELLPSQKLERVIQAAVDVPDPSLQFLTDLGEKLDARARGMSRNVEQPRSRFELFRQPGWRIAVAIIIVAMLVVLAIGPQRVLAQVQRWLGYVPRIGFVDLQHARLLAAPVVIQREGVGLKVEQALADPERTLVVISGEGLPPESVDFPTSRFENLPAALLRLPDGNTLEVVRQDLYYGGGKLQFPALPEDVYKVTLEIDRLPLLPAGAVPEKWQVPLLLLPATGELPADVFPQPYEPMDASAKANGVTARILQVAQSTEETALQVQFEWENPDWEPEAFIFLPEIRDDLGNVYQSISPYSQVVSASVQQEEILASPAVDEEPEAPIREVTYRFPALSLAAREAVFRLPYAEFSVPNTAAFTFDPGLNAQLGQTWELDETLDMAGVPLHLTGARLIQDDQHFPDELDPFYGFEFTFQTPTDLPRTLSVFFLATDLEGYRGGGGGMHEPGVFQVEMLFTKIPQTPVRVTFEHVRITLKGPWEMRWQIPWSGGAALPASQASPEGIEETQAGVTLRVAQTLFSDKLSVINLAAPDLSAGERLLNLLPFDPSQISRFMENQLYLETVQGQRIDPAQNVSWQPEGEAEDDPGRLVFDALPPQTERLTLHVPAVELFLPGQGACEITVPEGVTFHSEEFNVPDINRNDQQPEASQIRWLSEPWEVDIPLEVAGYRLHFVQAQIERDLNAKDPYQFILTSEPLSRESDGKHLSALNIAAITRPDDQRKTGEEVNETMRWFGLIYDRMLTENYDPSNWNAKIFVDVSSADRPDLLPGRYRIEIDGATAWVSGPWELSFSVSGD